MEKNIMAMKNVFDEHESKVLQETIASASRYCASVESMEHHMKMLYHRCLDAEEYQSDVKKLDTRRRSAHDSFTSRTKALNRICENRGLQQFYEGDIDDRMKVSDFAFYLRESINEGEPTQRVRCVK